MEVAHRDPAKAWLAEALRAFPLDHAARRRLPAARALQAGRPVLIPDYTEQMLQEETEGEYLELARKLRVLSVLVVPVTLSSSLATMTFMTTVESARRYGEEDVALAEELVRRAAADRRQRADAPEAQEDRGALPRRPRPLQHHALRAGRGAALSLDLQPAARLPRGRRGRQDQRRARLPGGSRQAGRPGSRRHRAGRAHPGRGPDLRARRDPSPAGHAGAPARPLGSDRRHHRSGHGHLGSEARAGAAGAGARVPRAGDGDPRPRPRGIR